MKNNGTTGDIGVGNKMSFGAGWKSGSRAKRANFDIIIA